VNRERNSEVVWPVRHLEQCAQCKARWVWAGAVAKYLFGHVAIAGHQGRKRIGAAAAGKDQHGRCTAGQRN